MRVLFVCNNAFNPGNGLSVSARNTIKNLRAHGVDARLMAVRNPDPDGPQPDFPLRHFKFPIFEPVIRKNGFCYAKIDRDRIDEAIRWADVVHFEEAFPLEDVAMRMAKKLGKACVGTFHLFPHNVAANLGFRKNSSLNGLLMKYWNAVVFNKCSDIQCPTQVAKDYLEGSRCTARLHVISNGVQIPDVPVAHIPPADDNILDVLCVGRLSNEKSQGTLLEAMRYTKYADRIRITFAGNGPKEAKYKRLAQRLFDEGTLSILPNFGFYTPEELAEMARRAYLYVHCAWVEVEGLSCVEAVREGAVPVIAQGDLIGTTQFALVPESMYPERDSKALAERIDWWIEHREEHDRMSAEYAASVGRFNVDDSIAALIKMYETAIAG
ncbi:MAG: glycosyltransferase [Bacteroidales bacterium]|nr:glycosyltransferase [Bacteroidales bacterium]